MTSIAFPLGLDSSSGISALSFWGQEIILAYGELTLGLLGLVEVVKIEVIGGEFDVIDICLGGVW